MLIRWTFIINDKPVSVEVRDEKEDQRIGEMVNQQDEKLLFIPGIGKDAYVNLALTSVILREEVNEQAPSTNEQAPVGAENGNGQSVA